MSRSSAEIDLNKLRKKESNKKCVNCDSISKFGHQYVCEKYKTFVCGNCKSAHQSFSMRVKSITMSNWTNEDVIALKDKNGGGNESARRKWFSTWNQRKKRKPTTNDHLNYYKEFIKAVYIDQEFCSSDAEYEDDIHYSSSSEQEDKRPKSKPSKPKTGRLTNSTKSVIPIASNSADLLDFSTEDFQNQNNFTSFDPFGMSDEGFYAQNINSLPSDRNEILHRNMLETSNTSGSNDHFENSASKNSAWCTPNQLNTTSNTKEKDPFDPFGLSGVSDTHSKMNSSPSQINATASIVSSLDPFATQTKTQVPPKPVMRSNVTMSQSGCQISNMMDLYASPTPPMSLGTPVNYFPPPRPVSDGMQGQQIHGNYLYASPNSQTQPKPGNMPVHNQSTSFNHYDPFSGL